MCQRRISLSTTDNQQPSEVRRDPVGMGREPAVAPTAITAKNTARRANKSIMVKRYRNSSVRLRLGLLVMAGVAQLLIGSLCGPFLLQVFRKFGLPGVIDVLSLTLVAGTPLLLLAYCFWDMISFLWKPKLVRFPSLPRTKGQTHVGCLRSIAERPA